MLSSFAMSIHQIPKNLREATRYFQLDPDLVKVKQLAHQETVSSERLHHIHTKCFYVQAGGKALVSYFINVVGSLTYLIGACDLSKRCTILSIDLCSDFLLLDAIKRYGSDLKMPILNMQRKDTSDVFLKPIPSPLYEAHSFYHPHGVCRGISDWFIFLYLKTRRHFTSSEKQILAVAKIFEQGAPRASTLIQSMNAEDISWQALKLKVTTDVLTVTTQTTSIDKIARKIHRLPKGIYGIYFVGKTIHRLNYIRTSTGKRFIINPQARAGLINISSKDTLLKALNQECKGKTALTVDQIHDCKKNSS